MPFCTAKYPLVTGHCVAGGGRSLIRRDDVMEVDVRLTVGTDYKHQKFPHSHIKVHGADETRVSVSSLAPKLRKLFASHFLGGSIS